MLEKLVLGVVKGCLSGGVRYCSGVIEGGSGVSGEKRCLSGGLK